MEIYAGNWCHRDSLLLGLMLPLGIIGINSISSFNLMYVYNGQLSHLIYLSVLTEMYTNGRPCIIKTAIFMYNVRKCALRHVPTEVLDQPVHSFNLINF